MVKDKTNHKGSTKQEQIDAEQTIAIDFGTRTISNQNFSKIVALPKQALANCGIEETGRRVRVQLIQQANGEKFIKLSPTVFSAKEVTK